MLENITRKCSSVEGRLNAKRAHLLCPASRRWLSEILSDCFYECDFGYLRVVRRVPSNEKELPILNINHIQPYEYYPYVAQKKIPFS